ncbi:MAG: glycosyltransferase family 4 protein [Pseudobdellovibrionaceae bacterium]
MKRVLLLTQYYLPENGAAQVRLAAMTTWLNRNDVDVEVVCPFPNYPQGQLRPEDRGKIYEKSAEVRWSKEHVIHRFWLFTAMGKGFARLLSYITFCVISFFSLSKVQKPDLVLVNSGPLFLALPGIFIAWWFKVPCHLIVADLWPRSMEHIGGSFAGKIFLTLMKWLERWAYRHADGITAVTEGIKQTLLTEEKIPDQKVFFLPNGVDLTLFEHAKIDVNDVFAELKLSRDQFLFIYPGNLGNAHALETILEVANHLQKEARNYHFLFIGGGSEKPKLIRMREKLGLKNVTFLDSMPMEKLVRYIQAADCGLIHMKNSDLANETRPAKMFPLMAASLPILFCGFGEGQKLIDHQSELFCSPEDVPGILQKIKSLPDATKMLEYGHINRQIVERDFSVDSLVETWWKHLMVRDSIRANDGMT